MFFQYSFRTFDLTGGWLCQKLVNAGNQALVSLNITITRLSDIDGMNQLGFNLNQNNLVPWYTTAGTQYYLSGATLQPGCSSVAFLGW